MNASPRSSLACTDAGSGLPLVLLHAFPLDREMWQPQLGDLSNVVRVLAVDLPGFGQSPPRDPVTVDTAADAVVDFLTASGVSERVVVAGLSMGGYVAMAFARRHADRLAGLILADTKSEPDDEAGKQTREKMIALAKEKGAAAVIEQMLPKALSGDTRTKRPDVVEAVRAIASRQSTEGIVSAIAALRDRPDSTPGLAAISVPTLIIVGEHDAITPPQAASAMASRIRASRLVTIPGAGHLSNLENPVAFNTAVRRFLQSPVISHQ